MTIPYSNLTNLTLQFLLFQQLFYVQILQIAVDKSSVYMKHFVVDKIIEFPHL